MSCQPPRSLLYLPFVTSYGLFESRSIRAIPDTDCLALSIYCFQNWSMFIGVASDAEDA